MGLLHEWCDLTWTRSSAVPSAHRGSCFGSHAPASASVEDPSLSMTLVQVGAHRQSLCLLRPAVDAVLVYTHLQAHHLVTLRSILELLANHRPSELSALYPTSTNMWCLISILVVVCQMCVFGFFRTERHTDCGLQSILSSFGEGPKTSGRRMYLDHILRSDGRPVRPYEHGIRRNDYTSSTVRLLWLYRHRRYPTGSSFPCKDGGGHRFEEIRLTVAAGGRHSYDHNLSFCHQYNFHASMQSHRTSPAAYVCSS